MKIQKCLHLKDELKKKTPKLKGNFLISPKIDGWYVQLPYRNNKLLLPLSSNGRSIPAFSWVANTKVPLNGLGYIIAEAYLPNTPFHITNGIFNRSVGDYHCKDVIFAVHDLVQLGKFNEIALNRYKQAREFVELFRKQPSRIGIELLAIDTCLHEYDKSNWERLFDTYINSGYEGLVAKNELSLYQPGKRNSDLLKLKLECTVDLQAVRLERSIGDKGNEALTLISRRKNGVEIRTVIAAFKDQETFTLLENYGELKNTVVEIKAMEEYEDGQLRQAVYKCIRQDKSINEID